MLTGDKLSTVLNWTYSFEILEQPDGRVYGKILWASFLSTHRYTNANVYIDDVISEAYALTVVHVIGMIEFLEDDNAKHR